MMTSLVLAGEAVFGLPFHVSRYFRPTFVEVFEISQTELGALGSIYGAVAMASYVLGGGLADRFSPRALLAVSLVITGAGGFYMATIPSLLGMKVLFGFWGASTILPFWSALIRATREWGSETEQGRAFGLLDGGRGLLAAVLANLVALPIFALLLPNEGVGATAAERVSALRGVIFVFTASSFVAAAFAWICIRPGRRDVGRSEPRVRTAHLITALRMPAVWLQAIIIIAAYCMYKGGDYYSQYAKDVWGWTEVEAAGLGAFSVWMRPIAAIGAGLLADRLSSSRTVIGCFVLTAAAWIALVFAAPGEAAVWLLWTTVLATAAGAFALRGVYYALLEESNVPLHVTGTAVGVIAFIGYTPEIFMPLLGGWLIEHGETGFHTLFWILAGMSVVGIAATIALRRTQR